ncbi:MAG: MFS transporter [Chloroflexota bacterium]|nr:MFS transporter [Chloroflexota bacterium]MDE2942094.1 MFS transporter [Chloroflexota bacterium]MDE3268126.1 MFS transporter [Chloroflexota bacterium]
MNGTLAQVIQFRTRSEGYGWVVMGFLWAVNLLIPLAAVSLGVMLPPMTEELGISPIEAGLLGASWFLGSALVSLPASIWLSRFSPKWVTFYSTFLAGILLLVQGWAPSFGVLLVARFVFVTVVVCRVQAEVLLVHQWFSTARVAVVMSLTIGIMSIGQLAAVGLIPVLMDVLSGWRNVYIGLGAGLLVGAALWTWVGRERARPTAPETERARGASPLRVLRRYRFLWVLAAAPSGAALAWGALMTFWPTLALDNLGLSLKAVGALMMLFPAGGIAASFLAGPLSNLAGRRKPFLWVPGLLLPPIYIALYTTEITVVAGILLLVAGWNAMIWVPIIRTIPFDLHLSPRETAVATGLGMTVLPIVGALGPPIVGVIQEATGSLQVGLLSIVGFPLTLVVGGLLIPETSPRRRHRAAQSVAKHAVT